jgi:hypothetical protein
VVTAVPYEWTERSMHFHAKWRTEKFNTRPFRDWPIADLKGKGVFVGDMLSIMNPVTAWWGEGDEKIYLDGEPFPSHFGTGTEDYYGYAWCWPVPFNHVYHNEPRCDGPGNYGHTSVNRFHVIDRIPFTRDFRFDMELWHWHESCRVDMAVCAYWYARPGGRDQFQPITPADLQVRILPPYQPTRVAGAIEGEQMSILEKAGVAEPQGVDGCSGEQHLWWRDAQPGGRLVLALPAPAAGRYRVLARCVTAGDYGIMQISINDQPAGGPRDFYNPAVAVGQEFEVGVFALNAGQNSLVVQIEGANDKAAKRYMFGLDYIRLESAN